MGSAVIGEDVETQVIVVARNALPTRSSRRQSIPSSLPAKSEAYSRGRVRRKRGQQSGSKRLDEGILYPYARRVSILLRSLLFALLLPLFEPCDGRKSKRSIETASINKAYIASSRLSRTSPEQTYTS